MLGAVDHIHEQPRRDEQRQRLIRQDAEELLVADTAHGLLVGQRAAQVLRLQIGQQAVEPHFLGVLVAHGDALEIIDLARVLGALNEDAPAELVELHLLEERGQHPGDDDQRHPPADAQ